MICIFSLAIFSGTVKCGAIYGGGSKTKFSSNVKNRYEIGSYKTMKPYSDFLNDGKLILVINIFISDKASHKLLNLENIYFYSTKYSEL